MIIDKTVAKLLLDVFGGNNYYAQSQEKANGDIIYSPVEVPLNEEIILRHLAGEITLGSYQLIQGSNVVNWLGWDVDSTDLSQAKEHAKRILQHLQDIPHAIEFSGRKGYHILIFLERPMRADYAKKFVEAIRTQENFASSGHTHVECFPKQDRLLATKPKGNLLKIPLGRHPKSHEMSRFIDPDNGWESGNECDPIEILQAKVSPEKLDLVLQGGEQQPPEDRLVTLIADHWTDGKRHDLSLYLAGFLIHEGWGVDATKSIIENICKRTNDSDVFNRLQSVETTYLKFKDGKSVRGRQGLGELLPVTVMQQLTELIAMVKTPDTVAQIDDIRYSKGRPPLESARLASNTIWSILNDNGSTVFQTIYNTPFWYDAEEHTVTGESTEMWKALLNKRFGFNPNDGFSKLVYAELHLRILREAPIVPVYQRTYWSEETSRLYVNLGGPEVYILDGKEINVGYNGECGVMFVTNDNKRFVVPDFSGEGQDVWDHLVNDLSFTSSKEAPAKPEEQRELLKAWILAFFFQELMPTKPILSLIGTPGSGKTTAMRRIGRILEDPDTDVLSIQADKPDSIRASIEGHSLLVLDNLEKSGAWWLVDVLNRLATGSTIELRELYHTNAKHTIVPRCFISCTAVNIPFSDETLFTRLLVLELETIANPLPEHSMQRKLKENSAAIWGDLLRKLNIIVSALAQKIPVTPPNRSRLVDFTTFCEKIKDTGIVDHAKLDLGLLSMVDSQMRQLKESSQAINLLEEWVAEAPAEASKWHSYNDIFSILSTKANVRKVPFPWKSSQALGRHLQTLEDRLIKDFHAEVRPNIADTTGKVSTYMRFPTAERL